MNDEADIIDKIPLSLFGAKEKLVWWLAKNSFSVKSTYFLEMQNYNLNQGESSNHDTKEQFWKAIWSLNIQGVVKHFIWKACYDSLLTRSNLSYRKITNQVICPICEHDVESLTHVLWEC